MKVDSALRTFEHGPDDPIRLLAAYEHIVFPEVTASPQEWRLFFARFEHNLQVTICFGTSQMEVLAPDTELYDTSMKARTEAMAARPTVKAALSALQAGRDEEFRTLLDKLKDQYATLIGHIAHRFFIDRKHRPLMAFVEEKM